MDRERKREERKRKEANLFASLDRWKEPVKSFYKSGKREEKRREKCYIITIMYHLIRY